MFFSGAGIDARADADPRARARSSPRHPPDPFLLIAALPSWVRPFCPIRRKVNGTVWHIIRYLDEMREEPEPSKCPSEAVSIPVQFAWRIVACVLGIGALDAGGYAVFATTLEAGPVALLAVGFLFLVIGMSGTLPNCIKFGDNEATWLQKRAATRQFMAHTSPPR